MSESKLEPTSQRDAQRLTASSTSLSTSLSASLSTSHQSPLSTSALRHRQLIILSGSPEETRRAALKLLSGSGCEPAQARQLWVSDLEGELMGEVAESISASCHVTRPHHARRLLGRSFDAVALEAHSGWRADVIGQSHGLVWGGGALILRVPTGFAPRDADELTRNAPSSTEAHSAHATCFVERLEVTLAAHLKRFDAELNARGGSSDLRALTRRYTLGASSTRTALTPLNLTPERAARETEGQRAAVDQLCALMLSEARQRVALTADRGRGKSSALGLAIAQARRAHPTLKFAVSAGQPEATHEVFRFALGEPKPQSEGGVRFLSTAALIQDDLSTLDVILIDEAAQLPVQVLQHISERAQHAHLIFATTTRGYEGTGRGFSLRFLTWLEARALPLTRITLSEPMRWSAGDPLERWLFDALLFDVALEAPPTLTRADIASLEHVHYQDRRALARDERTLRGVFGLLVHAHYRTTPSDLQHLLDAPNVEVHALRWRGCVVAATLIAREGEMSASQRERVYWGRERARGQALAEVLVGHLSELDAGGLSLIRSVRIATHPELRRLGLATALIERVHATYQPDLFGTLFGVTEGLVAFRRSVGYELMWVSASRGSRTGEPSAFMMRPRSDRARALAARLRLDLARALPTQLKLAQSERALLLSPPLERALLAGLMEQPPQLTDREVRRRVAAYVFGPRTYESSLVPLDLFTHAHLEQLTKLSLSERALIEARVIEGLSWAEAQVRAGMPSIPATMKGLRRALRVWVAHVDPQLERDFKALL